MRAWVAALAAPAAAEVAVCFSGQVRAGRVNPVALASIAEHLLAPLAAEASVDVFFVHDGEGETRQRHIQNDAESFSGTIFEL